MLLTDPTCGCPGGPGQLPHHVVLAALLPLAPSLLPPLKSPSPACTCSLSIPQHIHFKGMLTSRAAFSFAGCGGLERGAARQAGERGAAWGEEVGGEQSRQHCWARAAKELCHLPPWETNNTPRKKMLNQPRRKHQTNSTGDPHRHCLETHPSEMRITRKD